MLCASANWDPCRPRRSLADVRADPLSSSYLDGWGRPGDAGIVVEDACARPIGAAWYRLFTADAPGLGQVDATVPELVIAVVPSRRGEGAGASLMNALLGRARTMGLSALSLSVGSANTRAIALYERHGFRRTAADGSFWTMRVELAPYRRAPPR
jgi:GNAT superfamily N-acetyltransferase